MNLILLEPEELASDGTVRLAGRRREHLSEVLRAVPGKRVLAGVRGGARGRAELLALDGDTATLRFEPEGAAPPPLDCKLFLALPRPQTLRKVLGFAIQLGVKEIWFFHAFKVEKSYWQSSCLEPEWLAREIDLNLEQSADPVPPKIEFRKRFRTFFEDEFPDLTAGTRILAAHPGGEPCPALVAEPISLVLGPEGGFNDFEIEVLRAAGAGVVGLGTRILRTETALPTLLGRLKNLP